MKQALGVIEVVIENGRMKSSTQAFDKRPRITGNSTDRHRRILRDYILSSEPFRLEMSLN